MKKKLIVMMLAVCVLAGGCGENAKNGAETHPSENKETTSKKKTSNLYKTEDLVVEGLEDVEFKIPMVLGDDIREDGKWKYYYYEDLMLATNIEKNEGITNEGFVDDSDAIIDGMVENADDGRLIRKEIAELSIGKAVKGVIERTINSEAYENYFAIFSYKSTTYYIGFMGKKDSEWDYSKDFDFLIESIEDKGEAGFSRDEINNYSNDFESFKKWFNENAKEINYSEHSNEENKETYKTSTGTVSDILSSIKWIDFIQRTEEGYFAQTAELENTILENSAKLENFQIGDGIKLYYYINNDGEAEVLATEKVEPTFTIDDYVNSYKEKCVECSYEDIARNPDNANGKYAKLTGEVIQVMESGSTVQMRVNITRNEYGYYSDTIFVHYSKRSDEEDRILENDIITIYGKLSGTETYTAVLGQEVSLPKIYAEYIEIQ